MSIFWNIFLGGTCRITHLKLWWHLLRCFQLDQPPTNINIWESFHTPKFTRKKIQNKKFFNSSRYDIFSRFIHRFLIHPTLSTTLSLKDWHVDYDFERFVAQIRVTRIARQVRCLGLQVSASVIFAWSHCSTLPIDVRFGVVDVSVWLNESKFLSSKF